MEISRTLWQFIRDEPSLDANNNIIDFSDDNNDSTLLKSERQITGQTVSGATKDVEIMVPLKYLHKSWRTDEMT